MLSALRIRGLIDDFDLWRWMVRREHKERLHSEEREMMRPFSGPAKGKAERTFEEWLVHSAKQIADKREDRT